jgi:hypothetical protein
MHDPGVAHENERIDEEVRLLRIASYRTVRFRRSRLLSAEAKHVLGELCDLATMDGGDAEPRFAVRLLALAQSCGLARSRGSKCLIELERLGVVRVDASVRGTPRLPLRLGVAVEWRILAAVLMRGDADTLRKAPMVPAARGSRVA